MVVVLPVRAIPFLDPGVEDVPLFAVVRGCSRLFVQVFLSFMKLGSSCPQLLPRHGRLSLYDDVDGASRTSWLAPSCEWMDLRSILDIHSRNLGRVDLRFPILKRVEATIIVYIPVHVDLHRCIRHFLVRNRCTRP